MKRILSIFFILACIGGCAIVEEATLFPATLKYSQKSFPLDYKIDYSESLNEDERNSNILKSQYGFRKSSSEVRIQTKEVTPEGNMILALTELVGVEDEKNEPLTFTVSPLGEILNQPQKSVNRDFFPPIPIVFPQNKIAAGLSWETTQSEIFALSSDDNPEADITINIKYKVISRIVASNVRQKYFVANEKIELADTPPSFGGATAMEEIPLEGAEVSLRGSGLYAFNFKKNAIDSFNRVIYISISSSKLNINKRITRTASLIR